VDVLSRLRAAAEPVTYAPEFRRAMEEPIAGAIAVAADVPFVVTEGNYLLLDAPPWPAVRATLDEVWFLDVDEEARLARLVARHMEFGRSEDEAWARARGSDGRNALLISATRSRADLVISG
jgi:pantothenate kinase